MKRARAFEESLVDAVCRQSDGAEPLMSDVEIADAQPLS
jgi:hypothetical protein